MSRRWNRFWIGLVLGLLCPAVLFGVFYATFFSLFAILATNLIILTKLLSLCVFANLIIFYVFLNREFWPATRGIVTSTLLYTLVIVVIFIRY